jgi:hypothetical protein
MSIAIDARVQLAHSVIHDIVNEIQRRQNSKVLVFGLGFDTPIWKEAARRSSSSVIFVEENPKYIALNPTTMMVYMSASAWGTSVDKGHLVDDSKLCEIPDCLASLKFDVILVDGPTGYSPKSPGRQGSIWWSSQLCAPGGVVYIDDAHRPIESKSIERYFEEPEFMVVWKNNERNGSVKITKVFDTL